MTGDYLAKDVCVGSIFGRLHVLGFSDQTSKDGHRMIAVRCLCGREKSVLASELRRGSTVSCGCHRLEKHTKHGESKTRLHDVWVSMRKRCSSPSDSNYCNYGGRGIRVEDDFQRYEDFAQWARANGYCEGKDLTIERINVNGNYTRSNCHWMPKSGQSGNTRVNRSVVRSDGAIFITIALAARMSNLSHSGIIQCCRGRQHLAGGWRWRYATDQEVKNARAAAGCAA